MMDEIRAMLFSIGVEVPVAFVIALTHGRKIAGLAAAAAGFGTMLTHPFVWYGALALFRLVDYWVAVAIVETFAVLGEWPIYMFLTGFLWRRALLVSLAANGGSFLLGLWLFG